MPANFQDWYWDRLKKERSDRLSHRTRHVVGLNPLFHLDDDKFTERIRKTISILRHLQKARSRRE